MNDNIIRERIDNLDKVKEFIMSKILWENYIKNNDIKSVYNKKSNYNIGRVGNQ